MTPDAGTPDTGTPRAETQVPAERPSNRSADAARAARRDTVTPYDPAVDAAAAPGAGDWADAAPYDAAPYDATPYDRAPNDEASYDAPYDEARYDDAPGGLPYGDAPRWEPRSPAAPYPGAAHPAWEDAAWEDAATHHPRDPWAAAAPAAPWSAAGAAPAPPTRNTLPTDDLRASRRRMWWRALRRTVLVGTAVAVVWLAPEATLDAAAEGLEWLRVRNHDTGRAVVTTVLVAALLLTFVAEWGRRTATGRSLRLPGGGRMSPADLGALIADALTARPDIAAARVEARNHHRRGVAIAAEVLVTPDARLDDVSRFAQARIRACLREQAGATPAGPPRVRIRYRELDLRRSNR